jgi:hypothetical protein
VTELDQRFVEALHKLGLSKEAQAQDLEDDDVEEILETLGEEDEKVRLTEKAAINLFEHPDAHPYVLDLALLRKYGPVWMEWEVETLEMRIPQDFRTPSISDLNIEKLQAVKTLHYVDGFWNSWQVFLACVMPLNGLFPDFEVMQIPTSTQVTLAADIAGLIRNDVDWSDELKAYLGVVFKFDGIFCPIEPLDFVKTDAAGHPVDCEEIRRLWPSVRKSGKVPLAESVENEQLRRMLFIHRFLQADRRKLKAQLPVLLHG